MPARHLPLFFCFSFLTSLVNAQDRSAGDAFIKSKFEPYTVSLKPERTDAAKIAASPFKEIEVMDYRADTSRIGFVYDRNSGHRVLVAETGLASAMKLFLNHRYANASASHSLLVVIRKCWISDIVAAEPEHPGKPHDARFVFRAETYLKTDGGYIPFAYVDTMMTDFRQLLQVMPFRLADVITPLMEKVKAMDMDKALRTKRQVSYAFIDSFSNRKFIYVMNHAEVLQKGVYATLEDFKNNRPTINDYVIEKEKGTLALYLKDGTGNTYFSRKIWGYCDGQQSYAMINGNLYPVLRQHHAFYVFGAKDYEIKTRKMHLFLISPTAAGYVGSIPISQKVVMKLRMYTLDPETGMID